MATPSARVIAPGARILVRDAIWRVVKVEPTSVGSHAWHVVGVSEVVRDHEAIFLEGYEPHVEVLDPAETQLVADATPNHRGGLLYIESLLRDVPPADDCIRIGHRAAFDLLEFQLDPARQALAQLRPRILIADAVGLGKTLEAGVLLSELIRRGRARRILVVTQKSMLAQFQKELWTRFSIPLVRLDSVGLQRIRERIPTNHNPFHHHDRAIISIDTIKQNNAFRTHVEKARWDVIVIDEAQNVAERGRNPAHRARVARLLADRADALILLSATPHDGRARSFASLMNMLDPTAIANPEKYTPDDIRGLFIRRFKKDIQNQVAQNFPERRIAKIRGSASPAEEAAYDALAGLTFTRIDQRAHGGMLFRTTLEKALFSSPRACLQTIDHRLANLRRREDVADFGEDVASLEALRAQVDAIGDSGFSRYRLLLDLLQGRTWGWSPKRKDDRLVIFTERVETMKYLAERLRADLGLSTEQVQTLSGDLPDVDQQQAVEAFGQARSPVRILVATDVASEGLNLHFQSHRLIHFDIPWSLMVFQQRNGRIDRYGQEQVPEIRYLMTESGHPKIRGDQRILELLVDKDEQARKNIGDPLALLGAYDQEEEEQKVAEAIEKGLTPTEFEQQLDLAEVDPMELLLGTAAPTGTSQSTPKDLPALYPSDLRYLHEAVSLLREEGEPLGFRGGPDGRILELRLGGGLERRYERLPDEAVPEDGWVVLTDDPVRMQEAIRAARAEESAWPRVQYLWPLHPAMSWVGDRLRGRFDRHTAPVLIVPALPDAERVVLVSGLVPNRQSQALVHRWYGAVFRDATFVRVETFEALLARTKLGRAPLPNIGTPDVSRLGRLVRPAVDAVRKQVIADRDAVDARLQPRLAEQRARLGALRGKQHDQLILAFANRSGAVAGQARDREARRIDRTFDSFQRWVEETLTTERIPFLQVIALLAGRDAVEQAK